MDAVQNVVKQEAIESQAEPILTFSANANNVTAKAILVFLLDNDKDFNLTISEPKDELSKEQTDKVMQEIIDCNAIVKDGHSVVAIKDAYITRTVKEYLH